MAKINKFNIIFHMINITYSLMYFFNLISFASEISYNYRNDTFLAASSESGKKVITSCTGCHSIDKDDSLFGKSLKSKLVYIAPNLYGVYNRKIASIKGFNYSPALSKLKGKVWTIERLNNWLKNPSKFAPGTYMNFNGLLDPQDRNDVIAFLKSLNQKHSR